jgi:hypothetical protein
MIGSGFVIGATFLYGYEKKTNNAVNYKPLQNQSV